MLAESEISGLKDLLRDLQTIDLLDLARTLTRGVLRPSSPEEAINAILLHTADVRSLLLRKKITKALLFKYLHNKNISFPGDSEKGVLIDLIIQYWQESSPRVELPSPSISEALPNSQNTILPPSNIDLLATKFVEWFYNRLNATVSYKINGLNDSNAERLKEEDFWCDATLYITLTNTSGALVQHSAESATECLAHIVGICSNHSIFFSPNLMAEGLKGVSEPHGLVLVMNCGTLHSFSGKSCVGVYEQVFGLIKEPTSDNWKIKLTKLILRSQEVNALPQLTNCDQLSIINAL